MDLGRDGGGGGASDDSRETLSLTSGKNGNSVAEFGGETPGGAENVSDALPTRDGVSGIFARRIQRDAIDGLPGRPSAETDASTNLTDGIEVKTERRSSGKSLSAASSANWPPYDRSSYSADNSDDSDENNAADDDESCDGQETLRHSRKPFVGGNESDIQTSTVRSVTDRIEANAFFDKCAIRRPIAYYDYSCKKRNLSAQHAPPDELLAPGICKEWYESHETELDFLRGQFPEVLPRALYDVVRKRFADPVHYIAHCLIKYEVDKSMNARTFGPNRPF